MKTKSLRIVLSGTLLACGLTTFSCLNHASLNPCDPGVAKIGEKNIQLSGVPIVPADEAKLKSILKQFDRSLYRIDIFKEGKRVEVLGTLDPEYLNKVTAKIVAAKANCPGFTGWGDQFGYAIGGPSTKPRPNPPTATTKPKPPPTTRPSPPISNSVRSFGSSFHAKATSSELSDDDQELLRRVKPILEKYTHPQFKR